MPRVHPPNITLTEDGHILILQGPGKPGLFVFAEHIRFFIGAAAHAPVVTVPTFAAAIIAECVAAGPAISVVGIDQDLIHWPQALALRFVFMNGLVAGYFAAEAEAILGNPARMAAYDMVVTPCRAFTVHRENSQAKNVIIEIASAPREVAPESRRFASDPQELGKLVSDAITQKWGSCPAPFQPSRISP